jgi:hypothetical protein
VRLRGGNDSSGPIPSISAPAGPLDTTRHDGSRRLISDLAGRPHQLGAVLCIRAKSAADGIQWADTLGNGQPGATEGLGVFRSALRVLIREIVRRIGTLKELAPGARQSTTNIWNAVLE